MADNPRPNAPASGAYGERKAQDDLERSLPQGGGAPPQGPPGQPPTRPTPQPAREGRPPGGTVPPGIPPTLVKPGQPNLVPPGGGGLVDPQAQNQAIMQAVPTLSEEERLILFLDVMSTSPGVSAETREWARLNLEMLVGSAE